MIKLIGDLVYNIFSNGNDLISVGLKLHGLTDAYEIDDQALAMLKRVGF